MSFFFFFYRCQSHHIYISEVGLKHRFKIACVMPRIIALYMYRRLRDKKEMRSGVATKQEDGTKLNFTLPNLSSVLSLFALYS